jgi:hypothetical protein
LSTSHTAVAFGISGALLMAVLSWQFSWQISFVLRPPLFGGEVFGHRR